MAQDFWPHLFTIRRPSLLRFIAGLLAVSLPYGCSQRSYESLGYEVVEVPEYLHYMMGGLHCFVNIAE